MRSRDRGKQKRNPGASWVFQQTNVASSLAGQFDVENQGKNRRSEHSKRNGLTLGVFTCEEHLALKVEVKDRQVDWWREQRRTDLVRLLIGSLSLTVVSVTVRRALAEQIFSYILFYIHAPLRGDRGSHHIPPTVLSSCNWQGTPKVAFQLFHRERPSRDEKSDRVDETRWVGRHCTSTLSIEKKEGKNGEGGEYGAVFRQWKVAFIVIRRAKSLKVHDWTQLWPERWVHNPWFIVNRSEPVANKL